MQTQLASNGDQQFARLPKGPRPQLVLLTVNVTQVLPRQTASRWQGLPVNGDLCVETVPVHHEFTKILTTCMLHHRSFVLFFLIAAESYTH